MGKKESIAVSSKVNAVDPGLKGVVSFLHSWKFVWENEVLECFPHTHSLREKNDIYDECLEALIQMPQNERLALENASCDFSRGLSAAQKDKLPHALKRLVGEWPLLSVDEDLLSDKKLSPNLTHGLKAKKFHELERLSAFLKDRGHTDTFVEWGAGQGRVSQTLAQLPRYGGSEFYLVDKNVDLLLQGASYRQNHFLKEKKLANLFHVATEVPAGIDRVEEHLEGQTQIFHLGVHCCGHFSRDLVKLSAKKGEQLLVVPCCHHLLSKDAWWISTSLENAFTLEELSLSPHALMLASFWAPLTRAKADKRKRVKKYRYGLHLVLAEFYGQFSFKSMGNSPDSLYKGPFREYLRQHLQKLNLRVDEQGLRSMQFFYEHCSTQQQIKRMRVASELRNWFAKTIEYLLATDLAVFARERGLRAKVHKLFDPSISPRNFAVHLHKS